MLDGRGGEQEIAATETASSKSNSSPGAGKVSKIIP